LDFRRPVLPTKEEIADIAGHAVGERDIVAIADLIGGFLASEFFARLARASDLRREQSFAFLLSDGTLVTGAFDVLVQERDGAMLVVDYKTDRLEGADPRQLAEGNYEMQRAVYALAALRAGATEVDVVHVFLEDPGVPAAARFVAKDAAHLQARIENLASDMRERHFIVAEVPHRGLCHGCPAEGSLCSWPLAMTRREAPDRLF
jgi:hypothetical protein